MKNNPPLPPFTCATHVSKTVVQQLHQRNRISLATSLLNFKPGIAILAGRVICSMLHNRDNPQSLGTRHHVDRYRDLEKPRLNPIGLQSSSPAHRPKYLVRHPLQPRLGDTDSLSPVMPTACDAYSNVNSKIRHLHSPLMC